MKRNAHSAMLSTKEKKPLGDYVLMLQQLAHTVPKQAAK